MLGRQRGIKQSCLTAEVGSRGPRSQATGNSHQQLTSRYRDTLPQHYSDYLSPTTTGAPETHSHMMVSAAPPFPSPYSSSEHLNYCVCGWFCLFTSLGVLWRNMVVTCSGFHLVTSPLFVPLVSCTMRSFTTTPQRTSKGLHTYINKSSDINSTCVSWHTVVGWTNESINNCD